MVIDVSGYSFSVDAMRSSVGCSAGSSDALPLVPPPIGAFNDFRQFRLFSAEAEFLGTINTLVCSTGCNGNGGGNGGGTVPEPATLWPFALATLALALRRLQIS